MQKEKSLLFSTTESTTFHHSYYWHLQEQYPHSYLVAFKNDVCMSFCNYFKSDVYEIWGYHLCKRSDTNQNLRE